MSATNVAVAYIVPPTTAPNAAVVASRFIHPPRRRSCAKAMALSKVRSMVSVHLLDPRAQVRLFQPRRVGRERRDRQPPRDQFRQQAGGGLAAAMILEGRAVPLGAD